MRAAYGAQPADTQASIADLTIEHDIFWSRGQIDFTKFELGQREQYAPSPHRLVRTHPGSKRRTLYLSAHASHVVGWPVADGRLLLLDLNTHATQPQFVYSHQWREGDLVIWDRRCTMHRGRAHDEMQPRDLRRAPALDVESTLEEAA
jgi:alpha-ketoglutarate-dependent 2,4-dichlorophenoxyacetate dioxygenase